MLVTVVPPELRSLRWRDARGGCAILGPRCGGGGGKRSAGGLRSGAGPAPPSELPAPAPRQAPPSPTCLPPGGGAWARSGRPAVGGPVGGGAEVLAAAAAAPWSGPASRCPCAGCRGRRCPARALRRPRGGAAETERLGGEAAAAGRRMGANQLVVLNVYDMVSACGPARALGPGPRAARPPRRPGGWGRGAVAPNPRGRGCRRGPGRREPPSGPRSARTPAPGPTPGRGAVSFRPRSRRGSDLRLAAQVPQAPPSQSLSGPPDHPAPCTAPPGFSTPGPPPGKSVQKVPPSGAGPVPPEAPGACPWPPGRLCRNIRWRGGGASPGAGDPVRGMPQVSGGTGSGAPRPGALLRAPEPAPAPARPGRLDPGQSAAGAPGRCRVAGFGR